MIVLIASVTSLHYFTAAREGQIHDFYRRLYFIPIVLGAFKFRFKGGVLISLIISGLYSPHIFMYRQFEDIGMANQLLEIVLFLFIGSITGYLVEQLFQKNLILSEQLMKITAMENLNENILNSMQNPLISVDCNHEITLCNKVANKTFELEKVQQRSIPEIIGKLNNELEEIILGKKKHKYFDVEWITNNEKYLYKTWIYPIITKNKIEGALIIFDDSTELLMLEQEVLRSEKLSLIGQMASSIAHEIRNPLGIVKTIIQTIISNNNLNTEELEGLRIVDSEINRTNNVITELLNFSKPVNGIKTIVNLKDLMIELIRLTRPYAQEKNVDFDLAMDANLEVEIIKEKFKQALMNIFLNSIEAMPEGGLIIVHGSSINQIITISITDNGIGIKDEIINLVFNPFFTTREAGTGLGLSMTQKIIEEHQGQVKIISQVNKGTQVIIKLNSIDRGENNAT